MCMNKAEGSILFLVSATKFLDQLRKRSVMFYEVEGKRERKNRTKKYHKNLLRFSSKREREGMRDLDQVRTL